MLMYHFELTLQDVHTLTYLFTDIQTFRHQDSFNSTLNLNYLLAHTLKLMSQAFIVKSAQFSQPLQQQQRH